jgi:hypothetical protein
MVVEKCRDEPAEPPGMEIPVALAHETTVIHEMLGCWIGLDYLWNAGHPDGGSNLHLPKLMIA